MLLLALTFIFSATACQSNDENNETSTNPSENDDDNNQTNEKSDNSEFPLTTTIEGKEITLEEKPERIAALSLGVAEIVIDLRGPESLAAVTDSIELESLTQFSDEADSIENKIAGSTALDPEEVISYDPDLVLLSLLGRGHGAESDANDILIEAGLPLASFSDWTKIDHIKNNYKEIGQLVSEEEKAKQIIDDIETKVQEAQEQIDDSQDKPTVLMLAQISPNTGPYILGPSSIAYDLIQLAGGESGSDILGLEESTPASEEHIIKMDPDYVILIEWGTSSDEFTEFKNSDAFQTLSAVENGNVKQMESKDIAQANRFIVDELDGLVKWLNGEE